MINWHRLFGLALTDFFSNSPYEVELEKDLSLKQQFLDIVIIKKNNNNFSRTLPDGLETMSQYNLLSYKSMREPFDDWALKELTGHYVNYRKQISPSLNKLIDEKQFSLYAISTRFPEKLSKQVKLKPISEGIYQINRGSDQIHLIVLSMITQEKRNIIWNLFSAKIDSVEYASSQYEKISNETSTIINQLFEKYQQEGIAMPYTMQDFQKEYVRDHLNILSANEVLNNYSPTEKLSGLSLDEKLSGLSHEEVEKYFKNK